MHPYPLRAGNPGSAVEASQHHPGAEHIANPFLARDLDPYGPVHPLMIPPDDGFYACVDAADCEWLSQWK